MKQEQIFISKIIINKVRHLEQIEIPLSDEKMKHLIITGKNGSGKTSLLDAIAGFIYSVTSNQNLNRAIEGTERHQNRSEDEKTAYDEINEYWEAILKKESHGIILKMNDSFPIIYRHFRQGDFVVAYYRADRIFSADIPKHVEKVEVKEHYSVYDTPRTEFIKYLLDMKMTEALARTNGKPEKAEGISQWFTEFEKMLARIFDNPTLKLVFDVDTFKFSIIMDGREPFDFNTMSGGYSAIMDIVVDLIMRMDKSSNKVFDFSMPGIVLIDEIETHLHLELQRNIMAFLTTIFPNIQFIVSTHSPFILNSLENVTIYDLENKLLVQDNLADVPYSGIVEGYFRADEMSDSLKEKYERYQELAGKSDLSDEDMDEIAELELYLDEIPDYLALDITTEYRRLKQDLRRR
ncbi:MAG: AAA family ATPase [Lachnospiraceae bacterium]|nr:AAA family ATPase [Lachnospiraceae bacterium]